MKAIDYSKIFELKCSKCKEVKPVSEFNKYSDASQPINGWRYYSWCRKCSNEQSRKYGVENRERRNAKLRAWRVKNPDAAKMNDKRGRFMKIYKLTLEQVDNLFESQGRKCAICLQETRLFVDHDHETGKVRGGLCSSCNTFLGRVEAMPYIVDNIVKYLGEPCHADVLLRLANQ